MVDGRAPGQAECEEHAEEQAVSPSLPRPDAADMDDVPIIALDVDVDARGANPPPPSLLLHGKRSVASVAGRPRDACRLPICCEGGSAEPLGTRGASTPASPRAASSAACRELSEIEWRMPPRRLRPGGDDAPRRSSILRSASIVLLERLADHRLRRPLAMKRSKNKLYERSNGCEPGPRKTQPGDCYFYNGHAPDD